MAYHSPQWVSIWLDLIERAHGKDVRRTVKDILMENGVKTRWVGPETRLKQRNAYLNRKVPEARSALLDVLKELQSGKRKTL